MKLDRGNLRMLLIILGILFMTYKAEYFNVGIGLFFIGLIIHFISKGFLYRNLQLAVKGPYSFVRHPFYVANFFLDAGLIFMAGYPVVVIFYISLYWFCYNNVILNEEKELINIYGEEYKKYMNAVPRYFPKVTPYINDWYKGFKWGNILREREISRLLRLVTYPISFILMHEILKYRWYEPRLFRIAIGIFLVVIFLWVSHLFHNLIERDRMFKNISKKTIYLYFWIIIAIVSGALVYFNKMGIHSDFIVLPLVLLLFSFGVSFILFITLCSISAKMENKFK
jgi:hypothetical protein